MPYGRYKDKIGPHRAPSLTTKYKAQVRAAKVYRANMVARKVAAQARKIALAKARAAYQSMVKKPRLTRNGSIRF